MSRAKADPMGAQFARLGGGAPAPRRRQVALVPGAEVAALALDLPQNLRGQAREQVARRQLQDRIGLTEDSADMRPLQLGRDKSWTRVLIADGARLTDWRAAAGRKCKAILPDYLALPAAQGLWSFAATPQGVAARLGVDDGFSASGDMALFQLEALLATPDTKPRAALWQGDPVGAVNDLLKAQGIPVVGKPADLRAFDVDPPKVLGHGELALDLRRDPQLARTRLRRQALPWRWPLLIGAIAAGVWGYALHLETTRITDATRAMRAETQTLVQTHFVASGPVLDVRAQVSRALADLRRNASDGTAQSSALDLLARAGDVIAAEGGQPVQFSAAATDEITVIVRLSDFAAADRMMQALAANGLAVEEIESRVSDAAGETTNTVRTELRLRFAETSE